MIAENKEKYISFNVDVVVNSHMNDSVEVQKKSQLRFIEGFRFMTSGLDSLTNNLVKDGQKLTSFEDYSKEHYELLILKGVYPYSTCQVGISSKKRSYLQRKLYIVILT